MKDSPSEAHLHFAVLAADTVLFTLKEGRLLVRLMRVHRPPYFENTKGLPGGLLDPKETAEDAALRHLEAKAGIAMKKVYAEQLYTFSRIDRDPRGRVVAVAYLALVPWESLDEMERGEGDAYWAPLSDAHDLAYDHDEVLATALLRLRSRVRYTTLIQKLMPEEFTLTELEEAYEAILKEGIDKRNFRKKIAKLELLTELPHKRQGGKHRPARLYRFSAKKVTEIEVV